MLIHCIYASAADPSFDETDLPQLLQTSRKNNGRRDVTGMLLYYRGSFFQVLEGPAAEVDAVFETISRDPRHRDVTLIIREAIARRAFGEWSMGYVPIRADALGEIIGANDFFDGQSCLAHLDNGRAKKLLAAFGKGRWRTRLSDTAAGQPVSA